MIANLFSIFDPARPNRLSANWCSRALFILLLPGARWLVESRYTRLFAALKSYLFGEFLPIIKKARFVILIRVRILLYIMFNNVTGLLPYVFTSTAHLRFRLSFGLTAWLGLIVYGWVFNTRALLVHLIPQGTPGVLMPFMVLIERISNIIRPGTLAVRLRANIIAGHLLLSLLRSAFGSRPLLVAPVLGAAELALVGLECAVAFIQSYVFSVLLTLYAAEFSD